MGSSQECVDDMVVEGNAGDLRPVHGSGNFPFMKSRSDSAIADFTSFVRLHFLIWALKNSSVLADVLFR